MEIEKFIDHTLLSPQAKSTDIAKLCQEAIEHDLFAVCVNPYYVSDAAKALRSSKVSVATVIGFPLGANLTPVKVLEAKQAIEQGASELDMVINIGALKEGLFDYVVYDIESVVKAASGALVKVIIECDLLTDADKIMACQACIKGNANMVKTSTGFVKDGQGATVSDIKLIKNELKGSRLGIKASAGIRNYAQAISLIEAGANRIGTSSSIAILNEAKAKAK